MRPRSLEDCFVEFRRDIAIPGSAGVCDVGWFREFLVRHGGLKTLALPGREPQILGGVEAVQCYHFSQFLEWYLPAKRDASAGQIEEARVTLRRFNEWLLEAQAIEPEVFEENLESILGEDLSGGLEASPAEPGDDDESDEHAGFSIPVEQDFYVPGEYASTLSGEFTLTKVQKGILYGTLPGGGDEIGPILVDRTVSSGHRVGDRVHLSLGRAGGHWNLLSEGRRRE